MNGANEIDGSLKEEPGGADDEYGHSIVAVADRRCAVADKNFFKSIDELAEFIAFNEEEKINLRRVESAYHLRISQYYLSLIRDFNNREDPIRKQCVPSVEEIFKTDDEFIDPLAEEKTSPTPYLVHRYPDRVLLLVTNQCFMYCRHCTRKRLWQDGQTDPNSKEIEEALNYVRENQQIREIIVSGGDPLTLSAERLDYILSLIAEIKSVQVIRIGTRAPVVFPQRINRGLCTVLKRYSNLWINVQFNHPWEINPQSAVACRKLQQCGIPMSNQSVLLKGINDDPKVMIELCQKLQQIRVRPYYIFECDPVVGVSHFRTSVLKGVEILKQMRGYTSGMCVPTFVVDGIDGKGKVPLAPDYLVSASPQGVLLKNYKDEMFFYADPGKVSAEVSSDKKTVHSIGIIFNLRKNRNNNDDEEEYDDIETIDSLKKEIENQGFSVFLFEQNNELAENLCKMRPDFVLNLAEGVGRSRARESQIPALLESLNIPYSGSDPISLGIALDKYLTSAALRSAGIPVPKMFMIEENGDTERLKDLFVNNNLFVVKPRWEGSSKGIFLNSIVADSVSLSERIRAVHLNYHQPALVEEFVDGDEITVAVRGNHSADILGMMKIMPKEKTERFIYSLEVKRDWQARIEYLPESSIPHDVRSKLTEYALAAYRVLELRDFARIDFRVGKDNIPKIIDINPLPGLSPRYSDLPILYRLQGKTYSNLIKMLLEDSFKRYGFFCWQEVSIDTE